MEMKILKKHPSFSLSFPRTTCCFRSRSRSVMVGKKKEKRFFYFETIFYYIWKHVFMYVYRFFFFFSLNEIWRARQGCPMETPQDDKRFFFFFFLQCSFFTVPYFVDKKTKKPFCLFLFIHVRTKQYPPILRFAFISIYIIIYIFECRIDCDGAMHHIRVL